MRKHRILNLTPKLRVVAAILMVSSLSLFYPGPVSNLQAQSPNKPEASTSAGGPKEGIKVDGNWTIEIRNPDGKLAERREFKNALQYSGSITLGHFLQRTAKAGEWAIELGDVGNTVQNTPCLSATQQPRACLIYEPGSQFSDANATHAFKTLTISSAEFGEKTVLTGTATAQRDGIIQTVRTILSRCPVDSQGVCQPVSASLSFTTKIVSPSMNIVAGQIIQVTVVISFS